MEKQGDDSPHGNGAEFYLFIQDPDLQNVYN